MQGPTASIKEISARPKVAGENLENVQFFFRVGVTLNIHWAEPEDPSDPTHVEVIQVVLVFDF